MTWMLIIGMTLFGSLGGLLFKQVSGADTLFKKLTYFLIGCLSYGAGAILNVIVLRYLPYTVVFPLTAVTYIWTFMFSFFLLKEQINLYKLIGLACILAGAFVIVQ
jgi:drug/metabolite transporter (DMT)-like permease